MELLSRRRDCATIQQKAGPFLFVQKLNHKNKTDKLLVDMESATVVLYLLLLKIFIACK